MINKSMTISVLIEYVKSSVEILMAMKVEDMVKHKNKIENRKNKL